MIWEAPAKVNLSLELQSPDSDGMHPLRSLVQTIDWCDLLEVEEGDEDRLEIEGADLPDDGENLVWKGGDCPSSPARTAGSEPRYQIAKEDPGVRRSWGWFQ